ncbi:MAG: hypothetical protein ABFE08_17035 [Armatimonadia bacterium]
MRTTIAVVMLVIAVGAVWGQGLPAWDFEKPEHGWMTLDKQAELRVVNEPGHVYQGAGSLQFSFSPRQATEGDMPGVLLVPLQGIVGAEGLHLALQSSTSGPLLLALREQDESTYVYMIYVQAGDWHVLDLPLSDFILEESAKDENGKLDLDQVAGLGVVDPALWLMAEAAGGKFPFFMSQPNRRDLWLDEVKMLPAAPQRLRAATLDGAPARMVEDCDGDSAYWFVLGGRNLRVGTSSDQAVEGSSLRLDYELPSKSLLAMAHVVRPGLLQGIKRVAFGVRAGAACTLAVTLKEGDKSGYTTLVEVPEGQWQQFVLPLEKFRLNDEDVDPDTGLQPEKVTSILFIDVTALVGAKETANSLWLDEVMAQ